MKVIAALALLAPASAFMAPVAPASSTAIAATKSETVALAEANPDFLGKTIGFWYVPRRLHNSVVGIPLGRWTRAFGASEMKPPSDTSAMPRLNMAESRYVVMKCAFLASFLSQMAAFLGFCAQSTPLVSGPHKFLPFKGYTEGLTPQEQWDAIPLGAKLQIFTLIGMLESYGEILDPHYCNGGLPGYYPPIKGKRPEITLNLFDPLDFGMANDSPEKKARGRLVEINNGRLAMFGILSLLSEASTPGSVPVLKGLIAPYAGNVMIPFEGQFSIFS